MKKRPKRVTFLSILLIIIGSLWTMLHLLQLVVSPDLPEFALSVPEPVKYIIYFIGSFSILASGILIFNGEDLGRIILIIWCILALFIIGGYLLPRILYLTISILILFNKKSNEYFKESTKIRF